MAESIFQILNEVQRPSDEQLSEIKIGYVNTTLHATQLYTFTDKKSYSCRRYGFQDVIFDITQRSINDGSVSRIHVVIIPFFNTKKFALIDVGSLTGIRLLKKMTPLRTKPAYLMPARFCLLISMIS